jgi:hypothetical protein
MTKTNDIEELRSVLFDTLRQVSSKEKPMDIDRAKAICGVAQTIINSATLEVRAMNAATMADQDNKFFGRKSLPPAAAPRLAGKPAELPPSRVVDPLRTVKAAPPDPDERPRAKSAT